MIIRAVVNNAPISVRHFNVTFLNSGTPRNYKCKSTNTTSNY